MVGAPVLLQAKNMGGKEEEAAAGFLTLAASPVCMIKSRSQLVLFMPSSFSLFSTDATGSRHDSWSHTKANYKPGLSLPYHILCLIIINSGLQS
jgi:hypothetical protein